MRGGRRPTHAPQMYQQDKGKNIEVDEEGFQQVRNRKNTKINIFNIVNDEMRSSAFALAEEARAARYRSNPQEGEASRRRGGQIAMENPIERNQDESERKNTPNRVSTGGDSPKGGSAVAEEGWVEELATAVEGRGDPTSTMLWSPRKHAGEKRPLEREEAEDLGDEEELDTGRETAGFETAKMAEEGASTDIRPNVEKVDSGQCEPMQLDEREATADESIHQVQEEEDEGEAIPAAAENLGLINERQELLERREESESIHTKEGELGSQSTEGEGATICCPQGEAAQTEWEALRPKVKEA